MFSHTRKCVEKEYLKVDGKYKQDMAMYQSGYGIIQWQEYFCKRNS